MTKRVALLFHAQRADQAHGYMVDTFQPIWEADGYEVHRLYGVDTYVPADVLFLHVDLSVVPGEYMEFARRYPVIINEHAGDIRKRTISRHLVLPGDGYTGPVIVKSNLNFAGIPETLLSTQVKPTFAHPAQYQLVRSATEVPAHIYERDDLVVERLFLDQRGDYFCVHSLLFLGDRVSCSRLYSKHPVVNSRGVVKLESVEPDPEMRRCREELAFDYGKFDFVYSEGRPILIDANKTVGAPPASNDPQVLANRADRARGLYRFFTDA